MSKVTATDKRYEMVGIISHSVIEAVKDETGIHNVWLISDRTVIAAIIREYLAPLGRTERWSASVEGWARMVEAEDSLEWAFLQGSIWAAHAAE